MRLSVRVVLADAAGRLAAAGVPTPEVDAELLLAAAAGVPRSRLLATSEVPEAAIRVFDNHVERRVAREPLQHIVGVAPFRHIEVAVGPGVFVPRPETELLVDAVLPYLQEQPYLQGHSQRRSEPIVVDLCAGSGALALAVADELPAARVIAVENDEAALRWLRRNTAGTRVEVVAGDVTDPGLRDRLPHAVHAVVANPPYVPATTAVDPEVRADPDQAVFAGPDGLAVIPAVIALAGAILAGGGRFVIEHDDSHAHAVPALVGADGRFADVVDHADLTGRARFTTARRSARHYGRAG